MKTEKSIVFTIPARRFASDGHRPATAGATEHISRVRRDNLGSSVCQRRAGGLPVYACSWAGLAARESPQERPVTQEKPPCPPKGSWKRLGASGRYKPMKKD